RRSLRPPLSAPAWPDAMTSAGQCALQAGGPGRIHGRCRTPRVAGATGAANNLGTTRTFALAGTFGSTTRRFCRLCRLLSQPLPPERSMDDVESVHSARSDCVTCGLSGWLRVGGGDVVIRDD